MVAFSLRVADRFATDVRDEAARLGMSVQRYLHSSVSYALRRGENLHLYREIALTPRGGSTADAALDWLAARRPLLGEVLAAGTGDFALPVRRAMQSALSPCEYRRLVLIAVGGRTLEEVGQAEGCSKQAVHATVWRAVRKLSASDPFLAALCRQFPASGITPNALRAAVVANGNGANACG